jgi:hypothetical protein
MSELWRRFQREVKANRQKAMLLAGLFLFGCCFWVPMLTRAVAPKRAAAATSPAAASQGPSQPANSSTNPATASGPVSDQGKFWSDLANSLADDPMFQSAGVDSLSRDPFQRTVVEEPPPEPVVEAPKLPLPTKPEIKQAPLELNSTIIGRTRRAALISGQLYQLGSAVKVDNRSYALTKIESDRVVLSLDDQTIELTLTRTQLENVLVRGEPISPPSP